MNQQNHSETRATGKDGARTNKLTFGQAIYGLCGKFAKQLERELLANQALSEFVKPLNTSEHADEFDDDEVEAKIAIVWSGYGVTVYCLDLIGINRRRIERIRERVYLASETLAKHLGMKAVDKDFDFDSEDEVEDETDARNFESVLYVVSSETQDDYRREYGEEL